MNRKAFYRQAMRLIIGAIVIAIVVPLLYVGIVCWRVGSAEQELFGRNYLIPFIWRAAVYDQPPTSNSYGAPTYIFLRQGKRIVVYKQLINGFQHAYGSALCAFDLGPVAADSIFRVNEYLEAYLLKDGRSYPHYLDTKKDLFNNSIGRSVGLEARRNRLQGADAEEFMRAGVLQRMDSTVVINHFCDPRVLLLPSLEESGCPFLPHPSVPIIAETLTTQNLV